MTQPTPPYNTPQEALTALGNEHDTALSAVQAAIPVFTPIKAFTTFDAEYCRTEGTIVLHFFPPHDQQVTAQYWRSDFADVLVTIAPEFFQATAPRLVASYTEELNSWWVRAQGYSHIIDIDQYMYQFFELMDEGLDAKFRQDRG